MDTDRFFTPKGSRILSLLCIGAFLALVVSTFVRYRQEEARFRAAYGPDPAYVEYKLSTGSTGSMNVRDRKNAEAEIRAEVERVNRLILGIENLEIVNGELPTNYTITEMKFHGD